MANPIVTISPKYSNPDAVFDVGNDDSLSFLAIGLFTWILSTYIPPLDIPADDLVNDRDGADAVSAALRELAAAGYITYSEVGS